MNRLKLHCCKLFFCMIQIVCRGKVKVQGHKKIRGQGHRCKKKAFKNFFQAILARSSKIFSGDLQNFNNSKNTAVLQPRIVQFLRPGTLMCPRGLHLWIFGCIKMIFHLSRLICCVSSSWCLWQRPF